MVPKATTRYDCRSSHRLARGFPDSTRSKPVAGPCGLTAQASYTNVAIANAHNHADFKYTVGLGELSAVLNGVEFSSRHNDYSLRTPSVDNKNYGTDHRRMEITSRAACCCDAGIMQGHCCNRRRNQRRGNATSSPRSAGQSHQLRCPTLR